MTMLVADDQDWEDVKANEALVESIDGIKSVLQSMSAVNVAIATASDKTSEQLLSIDTKLGKINAKLSGATDNLASHAPKASEAMQSSLDQILAELKRQNAKPAEQSKQTKASAIDIKAITSLATLLGDNKKSAEFKSNAKLFAVALDVLVAPMLKLSKILSDGSVAEAMQTTESMLTSLGNAMAKAAKSLALIAVSMAAVVTASMVLTPAMTARFALTFPVVAGALAAGIWMLSGVSNRVEGIKAVALSITLLSLSMLGLQFLDARAIAVGTAALISAGAALAIVVRLMPTKKLTELSGAMKSFSIGVIAFGAAIALLGFVLDKVSSARIAKGALAFVALSGIVWLASKAIADGAKDFGKGIAWIALGIVALGASLLAFQELTESVRWETYAIVAASIAGLSLAVKTVGNTKGVWAGVGAMAAMTAVVAAMGVAIRVYDKVSIESLTAAGIALAGLGTVLYVAGTQAEFIALGAGALGLGVLAVYGMAKSLQVISSALSTWPIKLSMGDYLAIAGGIVTLGGAFSAMGGMAILAGLGVLAVKGIANALANLATGIKLANAIPLGNNNAADKVIAWAQSTVMKLSNLSLAGALKSMVMLPALERLGRVMLGLAAGVQSMAAGTFEEYSIDKDGNRVVTSVRHLTKDDYKGATDAMVALISGIAKPLAAFGSGGFGMFGFEIVNSDVSNGIASLSRLGDVVGAMVKVSDNFDKLKNTDFSIFGAKVEALVASTKPALESIARNADGSGPSWFMDSDYENGLDSMAKIGDVVGPMLKVAENFDKLKNADYSNFGSKVSALIEATKGPIETIGSTEGWFSDSDYENGLEAMKHLTNIVSPMIMIAQNFDRLKNADFKIVGVKLGTLGASVSAGFNAIGNLVKKYPIDKGANELKGYHNVIAQLNETATLINKLPSTDKLGSTVDSMVSSVAKLDTANTKLLIEAARAVESVANADLSKLRDIQDDSKEELMKLLASIDSRLSKIVGNTAKGDQKSLGVRYDYAAGYTMTVDDNDTAQLNTLVTIAQLVADLRSKLDSNSVLSSIQSNPFGQNGLF